MVPNDKGYNVNYHRICKQVGRVEITNLEQDEDELVDCLIELIENGSKWKSD